ncbi:hypothetical protein IRJ41_013424 [Triplophysa rosa]|uniref:Uncharacterized protein n=1 Tax=Triplophysa rosa TaxID=992332 RepID=A0A9W7T6K9_TRIRA|nr:hypothetical protein IRJ41_013424 [Triplophysa rosa]
MAVDDTRSFIEKKRKIKKISAYDKRVCCWSDACGRLERLLHVSVNVASSGDAVPYRSPCLSRLLPACQTPANAATELGTVIQHQNNPMRT